MLFQSLLYEIGEAQLVSPGTDVILNPDKEQLYYIDLNTRKITSPDKLSVESEHLAETIYFITDRYYDNMDLAQTNCIVQYVTKNGTFLYVVPYCDIQTYPNKMIIPWTISMAATQNAGTIEYSLRFYLLDESSFQYENNEIQTDSIKFLYSLSTLPAKSTILKTLPLSELKSKEDEIVQQVTDLELLIQQLNQTAQSAATFWIDV